ncbi:MAG: hypothetical protein ABEI97_01030 [Candidatus Nanohaloarchaea archaeon]
MSVDYGEALAAADFGGFMKTFGPGTYFKDADKRTVPVRGGHVFDDIDREYEALRQHHDIVPGHVPEPYAAAVGDDGEMMGYWMEEIDGDRMDQYRFDADPGTVDVDAVEEELEHIVEKLHAEESFHGDISLSNMFHLPGEDRIVLFDPVGTCEDDALRDELQEKDRKYAARTIANLEEDVQTARQDAAVPASG